MRRCGESITTADSMSFVVCSSEYEVRIGTIQMQAEIRPKYSEHEKRALEWFNRKRSQHNLYSFECFILVQSAATSYNCLYTILHDLYCCTQCSQIYTHKFLLYLEKIFLTFRFFFQQERERERDGEGWRGRARKEATE